MTITEEGLNTTVTIAARDFQSVAGIYQTGELDKETLELMDTPRYGVRDIIGHGAIARRKKRFL